MPSTNQIGVMHDGSKKESLMDVEYDYPSTKRIKWKSASLVLTNPYLKTMRVDNFRCVAFSNIGANQLDETGVQ